MIFATVDWGRDTEVHMTSDLSAARQRSSVKPFRLGQKKQPGLGLGSRCMAQVVSERIIEKGSDGGDRSQLPDLGPGGVDCALQNIGSQQELKC